MTTVCEAAQPATDKTAHKQTTSGVPPYRPQGLAVRVSYQCNIGCSHCYNQSLPGNDIAIDENRLLKVIEEGAECGFNNLGITGGEALLHSALVLKTIKHAKDNGYKGAFSLMTNGFWGRTEKSAANMVRMLGKAGFSPPPDRINLSSGEYHQEWIPLSNIKNIVSAYYKAFKAPIILDFEYTKGNDSLLRNFLDYFEKHNIPEEAYTLSLRKNIALLGRGRELSIGTNPPVSVKKYGLCKSIGRFVIQPDAKVVPCCGFNRFNRGIILGDVYKNSVQEIIEDVKTNIAYQYLLHRPLHQIHEILSRKFDLSSSYTSGSLCEACEEMFGKEEHVDYLEKVAHEELADVLHPGSKPGTKEHFHDVGKKRINGDKMAATKILAEKPEDQKIDVAQNRGKEIPPVTENTATAAQTPASAKTDSTIDLTNMSVNALNRLIADAFAIRDNKIKEERELRIRQIKQMAKDYRIDMKDLVDEPRQTVKTATPKPKKAEVKSKSAPAKPKKAAAKKSPAKAKAKSKAKSRKSTASKKMAAAPGL